MEPDMAREKRSEMGGRDERSPRKWRERAVDELSRRMDRVACTTGDVCRAVVLRLRPE